MKIHFTETASASYITDEKSCIIRDLVVTKILKSYPYKIAFTGNEMEVERSTPKITLFIEPWGRASLETDPDGATHLAYKNKRIVNLTVMQVNHTGMVAEAVCVVPTCDHVLKGNKHKKWANTPTPESAPAAPATPAAPPEVTP